MFVYILYSNSSGNYYTGQTNNFDDRLLRHNSGRVMSTKRGIPWVAKRVFNVGSRSQAMILENKIKKRGAKRF